MDDIYAQAANESDADCFHYHMNHQHPNIKFEIETPNLTSKGSSLSLLDFTVHLTEEGKAELEFYKKAKKPLFVYHKSALLKHFKVNIIRNERKCINQRCSTDATKSKHNSNLDGVLRLNGYPEEVINETFHTEPPNHCQPRQIKNPNWLYLKIPYISDSIN